MSPSKAFQDLIYDTLIADVAVAALVGVRIFDGPSLNGDYPHISFGAADFTPDNAEGIKATSQTLQIDVWTDDQGQTGECKEIVSAVYDALNDADLDMADPYGLVNIIIPIARIIPDPQEQLAHGILQVTGLVERV